MKRRKTDATAASVVQGKPFRRRMIETLLGSCGEAFAWVPITIDDVSGSCKGSTRSCLRPHRLWILKQFRTSIVRNWKVHFDCLIAARLLQTK